MGVDINRVSSDLQQAAQTIQSIRASLQSRDSHYRHARPIFPNRQYLGHTSTYTNVPQTIRCQLPACSDEDYCPGPGNRRPPTGRTSPSQTRQNHPRNSFSRHRVPRRPPCSMEAINSPQSRLSGDSGSPNGEGEPVDWAVMLSDAIAWLSDAIRGWQAAFQALHLTPLTAEERTKLSFLRVMNNSLGNQISFVLDMDDVSREKVERVQVKHKCSTQTLGNDGAASLTSGNSPDVIEDNAI